MAHLTNEFIKANKIGDNYQMIVNYNGHEMIISKITEKNIMLKQLSKLNRNAKGRFNSGNYRIKNDENSTQWYLKNRLIK